MKLGTMSEIHLGLENLDSRRKIFGYPGIFIGDIYEGTFGIYERGSVRKI